MPPVLADRLAQSLAKEQVGRIDSLCRAAYVAAARLPRRLMVRLRTLTPSIVVRIHAGHPAFPITIRTIADSCRDRGAAGYSLRANNTAAGPRHGNQQVAKVPCLPIACSTGSGGRKLPVFCRSIACRRRQGATLTTGRSIQEAMRIMPPFLSRAASHRTNAPVPHPASSSLAPGPSAIRVAASNVLWASPQA